MNWESAKGFTLIELMVTLTVAAILLAVAGPQLADFLRRDQVAAHANTFNRAISEARSVSATDSAVVRVCQSDDQQSCSGNDADWAEGWITWVDADRDATVDGGERVVRRQIALSGDPDLDGNGDATITFAENGLTGQVYTFDLVPRGCEDNQARQITINVTGRMRVQSGACP